MLTLIPHIKLFLIYFWRWFHIWSRFSYTCSTYCPT